MKPVLRLVGLAATSLAVTIGFVFALSGAVIAVAVALFGLTLAGAAGLYFVVWWTVLFAVLPFGIRSQAEEGQIAVGTEPGAPTVPALREKAIWTTVLAAVVFITAAWLLPLTGL